MRNATKGILLAVAYIYAVVTFTYFVTATEVGNDYIQLSESLSFEEARDAATQLEESAHCLRALNFLLATIPERLHSTETIESEVLYWETTSRAVWSLHERINRTRKAQHDAGKPKTINRSS